MELVKEGNRYVGEQARDKVIRIRSERSIGGLEPTIWRVMFYDRTTTFKSVEVKFGGGKMLDVGRPMRLFQPIKGTPRTLDLEKIEIDSDDAIALAQKESMLEKLTLKSVEAKLESWEEDVPVWKIRFWAEKLRRPSELADIGELILSAEDGKVLKNELRIDRVD